jgi:hypothetical protein
VTFGVSTRFPKMFPTHRWNFPQLLWYRVFNTDVVDNIVEDIPVEFPATSSIHLTIVVVSNIIFDTPTMFPSPLPIWRPFYWQTSSRLCQHANLDTDPVPFENVASYWWGWYYHRRCTYSLSLKVYGTSCYVTTKSYKRGSPTFHFISFHRVKREEEFSACEQRNHKKRFTCLWPYHLSTCQLPIGRLSPRLVISVLCISVYV